MPAKDSIQLIKKLTIKKVSNAIKVIVSYYISRLLRRPIQWGTPITVSIEPTTACNLRCPECPSGLRQFSRPTGNIKKDTLSLILDQIGSNLLFLIFYFQGEPYIHPKFLDMVAAANKAGIYTITSTNGHFLTDANARKTIESGLDRIIISVDGTTQSTYESYRKEGDLATVLEGTANLVRWKKQLGSRTPHIIFQFLVVRPNEHEIPKIYRLANEIGVDEVKLKSAQIYDYKNGNALIPFNKKHSRYRQQKDGTYRIKNKLLNHCWKLWHSCVITWDGGIVPCCFDKDAKYQFGKLSPHNSFEQIWHNKTYYKFRQQLLKNRKNIDICTNCTEGGKVWL